MKTIKETLKSGLGKDCYESEESDFMIAIEEIIRDYAKIACKEQREICAKDHFPDPIGNIICWESHVRLASEPKLL